MSIVDELKESQELAWKTLQWSPEYRAHKIAKASLEEKVDLQRYKLFLQTQELLESVPYYQIFKKADALYQENVKKNLKKIAQALKNNSTMQKFYENFSTKKLHGDRNSSQRDFYNCCAMICVHGKLNPEIITSLCESVINTNPQEGTKIMKILCRGDDWTNKAKVITDLKALSCKDR